MRFLKIIVIILLSLFTLLMGISTFSPERMELEESIVIIAPSESVFEEVNNFQNWAKWSPWEQKDPEMKKNISNPPYGKGAFMEWESKSQGNGKQIIETSEAGKHIRTKLTFTDWEGENYADFYFDEINGETTVTWTMEGAPVPFMMRWFSPFMKVMVKKDYQEGLHNLKILAESKPETAEMLPGRHGKFMLPIQ